MSTLGALDRPTVDRISSDQESPLEDAATLESASCVFADHISSNFDASLALNRIFVSVPFSSLPAKRHSFVKDLAKARGVAEGLRGHTPVLSLLASRGVKPEWNDATSSVGHLGIPLRSIQFVDAIPMVSRLLKDLGVGPDWIEKANSGVEFQSHGESGGAFYVADAAIAQDDRGRKIISAQDFVAKYGIRTVFGLGGFCCERRKSILVSILFTTETLNASIVETFEPLFDSFRRASARFMAGDAVFD